MGDTDEDSVSAAERRAKRRSARPSAKLPPLESGPSVRFRDGPSSASDSENLREGGRGAPAAAPVGAEVARATALGDYRSAPLLPGDVIAQGAAGPPAPPLHRVAPPIVSSSTADKVFRQDVTGGFKRVDMLSSEEQRRAGVADARGGSPDAARQGSPAGQRSGGISGGLATAPESFVGEGRPVPASLELKVASAIFNIVVAPTRFAPGLLAGAAIFEAAALAQLAPADSLATQPLSTLYLYSSTLIHVHRLMLWAALVSFVGVCLRIIARSGSDHYLLQPWRQMLDLLLIALYGTIAWLTFSNRQLAWTLASGHTSLVLPYLAPKTPADRPFYNALLEEFQSRAALLGARDVLAILTAALSLIPGSDEYYTRTPPYLVAIFKQHARTARTAVQPTDYSLAAAAAVASSAEHVLRDGYGFVEGGVSFLIGFWSVRGHMSKAQPPERAPHGGPAMRPLPWRTMNRSVYSWRVAGAMVMLLLDVIANTLADTVQWHTALGGENESLDLVAAIVQFVLMVGLRICFAIAFFMLIINTAHFRLGRYAELSRDFGGAFIAVLMSFATMIALRTLRIVMGARKDAVDVAANTFWTTPLGVVYSVVTVIHISLTAVYYIKGVSALRRAASSEYHTHPDDLRRKRNNKPAVAYQPYGAQMMPL